VGEQQGRIGLRDSGHWRRDTSRRTRVPGKRRFSSA
jgi:hypothetical protein